MAEGESAAMGTGGHETGLRAPRLVGRDTEIARITGALLRPPAEPILWPARGLGHPGNSRLRRLIRG